MIALTSVIIGALGATYSYFLYPLVLLLLPDSRRKGRAGKIPLSRLSLVVAARNEELRIREKLEECVKLRERLPDLEILVASDASTDATDAIVSEFAARGVRLVRTSERKGKEFAQRAAIRAAHGDVLVFTDTGTTIVPSSVDRLLDIFAEPDIGAVSSTDRLINADGQVSGEGIYIRYEMWLRELESRKGGLIGLSGSFFAARRSVCDIWDTDIPSDFAAAINCGKLGLRAISDPEVIGEYRDARNPDHEFARKVRTVIRGMTALAKKREILNPRRFGRLAFQLWSHKILRWAVPWFGLIYTLGALAGMAESKLYGALLLPPLAVTAAGLLAATAPAMRRGSVFGAAYFFLQVNLAAIVAAVQFLAGKRVTTWVPTLR